ncbi:MAG: hypothetical protein V9G18_06810 [Albidovulum sp.]
MLLQQGCDTFDRFRQRIDRTALIAGHLAFGLAQPAQIVLRGRGQFLDRVVDDMMIGVQNLEAAGQARLDPQELREIVFVLDPVMAVETAQQTADVAMERRTTVPGRLARFTQPAQLIVDLRIVIARNQSRLASQISPVPARPG